jgi:hypothetical protein
MKGRDPMKGRHNVGGRTGSAGKWPGSQAEPASNKGGGISGVAPSSPSRTMQPKPGVLANQAKTSADLQARLQGKAPQPFTVTGGGATAPTPSSPRGAKPGGESVANPRGVYAGKSGSTVTARALPSNAPIGQKPAINQSGQIGGRMGFPPPKRKAGDNGSGYPAKRNRSFYGE